MFYSSQQPLVSVIINCFNGEQFLHEAISSVFRQSYQNWEIIFYDNCSEDSSAKIASSFGPKLKLYTSSLHLKLYQARNSALSYCQGSLVTFLDVDDVWLPTKLEDQLKFIALGYEFVYTRYSTINKNSIVQSSILSSHFNSTPNGLLIFNPVALSSVMTHISILKTYRFNEHFSIIADLDCWFKIFCNHSVISTPNVLTYYRQHSQNLSKSRGSVWTQDRRLFYSQFLRFKFIRQYPAILIYIIRTEIKNLLSFFKSKP